MKRALKFFSLFLYELCLYSCSALQSLFCTVFHLPCLSVLLGSVLVCSSCLVVLSLGFWSTDPVCLCAVGVLRRVEGPHRPWPRASGSFSLRGHPLSGCAVGWPPAKCRECSLRQWGHQVRQGAAWLSGHRFLTVEIIIPVGDLWVMWCFWEGTSRT